MDKYEIIKDFSGSNTGSDVVSYKKGDIVPNDAKPFLDELARVAISEGWAMLVEKPVEKPVEKKPTKRVTKKKTTLSFNK